MYSITNNGDDDDDDNGTNGDWTCQNYFTVKSTYDWLNRQWWWWSLLVYNVFASLVSGENRIQWIA